MEEGLSFNTGKTFKEMLDAAAEIAADQWGTLQDPMEEVLESERDALRELASEWMRSDLSDKQLDSRLQHLHKRFSEALEKKVGGEHELIERVVDAALNSYWKSLMAAL